MHGPSGVSNKTRVALRCGLMPVNAHGIALCKPHLRDQDPTENAMPWAVHPER